MDEQRRSLRYPVQDVRGVLILSVEAKIVNVSLTGAALELASPIQVGQAYSLTVAGRGRVLRLQGRVVWCQPVAPQRDATGEPVLTYHAGLRFDGILDPKGERLLEIFRESVVLSFGQRLCTRFRLTTPRPVDLDAEHELEVRKVSRTGMLIETDLPAELDSECELEVQLAGTQLRTRGRIAHLIAHPGDADAERRGAHYQLGVEFLALSERDRQTLDQFLAARA